MVRLGRGRVLAQQLAAVEMLARVDVVCPDKTGTLTDGAVAFDSLEPLEEDPDAAAALAALAISDACVLRRALLLGVQLRSGSAMRLP